jgi:filamentous hemagglutinin family protein
MWGDVALLSSGGEARLAARKLTAVTLLRGACHALLLSGALMRPGAGYALPQGGVVSSGSANVTTVGNTTTITQSTNKAIIDWNSFNVNSGEHVSFAQPSSSSITLNRIHDANPSVIDGEITANGKVWLVNANGVFFGSGAQINVAGLVATTADIDNANFESGNYTFSHPGNPNAVIQNDGSITIAQAGLAAFVAPNVVNNGTITARLGKVALASGDTFALDMYGDGLVSVAVSNPVASQLVRNSGLISAAGGQVLLTAAAASNIVSSLVNNTGIIEANAAGVGQSGSIELFAAGHGGTSVGTNAGTLTASGTNAGETGGTVQILADNVQLMSGSSIDVSGDAGGGTVHVGGDFHGGNGTPTAQHTTVETGAVINASAITTGSGGQVSVWADDETDFGGAITARGGSVSGNGGYVETSGHILYAYGTVDAGATNGAAGTWLLDPYNVTIAAGAGVDTNAGCAGNPEVCTPTNNATIYANNISATLSGGTAVTITTGAAGASTGDITLNTGVSISSSFAGTTSLTLSAYRNITFTGTAGITTTNGKLNLILDAATGGNSGLIQINSGTINTHGGDIYMGGGALDGSGHPTGAAWGNGAGNSRFGINLIGSTVNAAGGSINLNGAGWTGGVNTASSHGIVLQGLAVVETTGSGSITMTGQGGGSGIGASSHGIDLVDTAGTTAISAGTGTITLIGTGGVTGGSGNYGINDTGSVITGSGPIILNGTGGIGAGSLGIMFNLASAGEAIQSTSGASVLLKSPGEIELSKANIDSTNATAFKVVIDANDANGGSGFVELTGSTINSSGGDIWLAGGALDGSGNPTGAAYGNSDFKYGVYFSGLLLNAGGGNIHMNGVGWSGGVDTSNAYGVYMLGAGVAETSGAGTISITGQGGGSGAGTNNDGIHFSSNAGTPVSSTGSGALTLTGTAGSGTSSFGIDTINTGITLGGASYSGPLTVIADTLNLGSGTLIETSGAITLKPVAAGTSIGVAGASGTLQIGTDVLSYLSGESSLTIGNAADTGLLTLNGYSTWNVPVSFISNNAGSILINGDQTATGSGSLSFTGPTTLAGNLTTAGHAITFNSAVTLGGNQTLSSGAGTVTFGSTVNGGYDLTASAGTFSFGGAWGGSTPLGNVSLTSTNSMALPSITASSIFARTTGAAADLTIGVGKTLTGTAADTAVTLIAGRNFINNAGAGAIATPDGRWLVYSTNPANDTDGGLANSFVRYSCSYGGSCPSFAAESGNGFLYSYTPTLTITPLDLTLGVGGGPTPYLRYSVAGYLSVADQNAERLSGELRTNYTPSSPKGTYWIGGTGATLAEKLGYRITYGADSTLTVLNDSPTNVVYSHNNSSQSPQNESGCGVKDGGAATRNCSSGMAYFIRYLTDELYTNP